jgi:hypothetical protein
MDWMFGSGEEQKETIRDDDLVEVFVMKFGVDQI